VSDRLKVVTIVGTRPEIIKLSRVLHEIERNMDLVLVHTGQNFDYELNGVFFQELAIRQPDHFLDVASQSVAATIAAVIERSDAVLAQEHPDAVLLYGDTNSCLSVIAAKRRKIPVFHMEAGNRAFDERVPEELNRRVIDHLSDVNMTNSEHARRYLLAEGLRPELVIKTGSPMREVLQHALPAMDQDAVLAEFGLERNRFLLVSCHREENVDDPASLRALLDSLRQLMHEHDVPVVVTTHPRTRRRLEALSADQDVPGVLWAKPFGFLPYLALQRSALCVISDSGTLTEEASLLGFPAVMIREAHERPEGIDVGVAPFIGLRSGRLPAAVDLVLSQHAGRKAVPCVPDYEAESVSSAVSRIILSYTDYINRVVWHRQQ
jgi:UDP-N-acetylglucosamine 2-epimerase (non-hydrolysing)